MSNQQENDALNAIVGITEMHQERNYASLAKFFDDMFAAYSSKLNKVLEPEEIDANYAGIHLNESYEEGDFFDMIESFNEGRIIHAKYALKIIRDSIAKFAQMPNVSLCNAREDSSNCVIVGDLHGSFKDLYYIIKKFGIPGKSNRFVFNVKNDFEIVFFL